MACGHLFHRRAFLEAGVAVGSMRALMGNRVQARGPAGATVALVSCRTYGPDVVETALLEAFDLIGGIGRLVKGKTVTVKANLTRTGTRFVRIQGRPPGETYITHGDTVMALCSILFKEQARRVMVVDSFPDARPFDQGLEEAGWDVPGLRKLGRLEVENTRNLGSGTRYSSVKVPSGGYLFSQFELNHCYVDTDVVISLAKLKNHKATGVTLSMKNMFGITPNSLYGNEAVSEEATAGRGRLHFGNRFAGRSAFPGQKEGTYSTDAGARVPRIIVDLCAARPIHLAIVDGITSVSGGEGPWVASLKLTSPGLLIAGLNPVAVDAVSTAIMGYDPRGQRGSAGFRLGDNHLLLAEQVGLGPADLSKIEVRGRAIEQVRYVYG
jgi:uncharacterized protein (DUF362 family)